MSGGRLRIDGAAFFYEREVAVGKVGEQRATQAAGLRPLCLDC